MYAQRNIFLNNQRIHGQSCSKDRDVKEDFYVQFFFLNVCVQIQLP